MLLSDLFENDKQLAEKWSAKYKSSINCSNPKGFSQRAHCQGKKKHTNESKVTLYTDPSYFGADVSDNAGEGL